MAMAMSVAERQAAYRRRRSTAGPKGDPEQRINTWVSDATARALARLARHHGISQRAMLERLIAAADDRITKRLDPDTLAWSEYMGVTQ